MTDIPAAAPPAEPSALALEPAQIAAMREQWIASGLDPARFDEAATGEPAAPPAPAQAPSKGDVGQGHDLTAGQVSELVAGLRAQGVPETDIQAALAADGYTLAPADERTEEQREFDDSFAGAAPEAYRIDYVGRLPAGTDIETHAAFNAQATAWLSKVGFPPAIGGRVIEHALDAAAQVRAMSETARALWSGEQAALFERVAGGPEQAAARRALAQSALARGGEEFRAVLERQGALHDATVVSLLALQGERLNVCAALN